MKNVIQKTKRTLLAIAKETEGKRPTICRLKRWSNKLEDFYVFEDNEGQLMQAFALVLDLQNSIEAKEVDVFLTQKHIDKLYVEFLEVIFLSIIMLEELERNGNRMKTSVSMIENRINSAA